MEALLDFNKPIDVGLLDAAVSASMTSVAGGEAQVRARMTTIAFARAFPSVQILRELMRALAYRELPRKSCFSSFRSTRKPGRALTRFWRCRRTSPPSTSRCR